MNGSQSVERIGIALSGGTLKAAAHIGVLSALEDIGIRPHCVAGTSAGSFVAALYAHGFSPRDFAELVQDFPGIRLFDYGYPLASSLINFLRYRLKRNQDNILVPHGMMNGNKLRSYFQKTLEKRQATMPFYVVATDILTGNPLVFSNDLEAVKQGVAESVEDDLASIIQGSCTLPGILTPVRHGKWVLVDGAFRHYVPVHVLRRVGCTKIIAVNLYRLEQEWRPETVFHVLSRSFDILLQETIDGDIEGKNLLTLEPNVSQVTWISVGKLGACVQVGRKIVDANREKLHRFLQPSTPLDTEAPRGMDHHKNRNSKSSHSPSRAPILKIQGNPSQTSKEPPFTGSSM